MDDIFDYRRFLLICMKKWIMVLAGLVLGSALFGFIYFIYSVGFSGPVLYRSESTYHITFDTEDYEALAVYYNDYTWNLILATDKIAGRASEICGISMEDINACVWKPMSYDIRMVTVYVDNEDAGKSESIQKAIGQALSEFPASEEGFAAIEQWDGPHTYQVEKKNFTVRMLVIGGTTGAVVMLLVVMLRSALDMKVYTLRELKEKTGIVAAGYIFDSKGAQGGEMCCDEMLPVNVSKMITEKINSDKDNPGSNNTEKNIAENNIGLCYVSSLNGKTNETSGKSGSKETSKKVDVSFAERFDIEQFEKCVKSNNTFLANTSFELVDNNANDGNGNIADKLSALDGVIVLVNQKQDDMTAVVRGIDNIKAWGVDVVTVIICNSSEAFYKAYYFGRKDR